MFAGEAGLKAIGVTVGRGLVVLALLLAAGCAGPGLDGPVRARDPGGRPGADASGDAARLTAMAEQAAVRGDDATAAGLFERVLSARPGDVRAAVGYGEALHRQRKYQEASEAHRRALRLDPADREAGRGFAKAMFGLNRPDAAAAQLEEQIRDRPGDDPETLNVLAVAYDLQGRHRDAAAVYRRALTLAPDDARLANNLGLSLALAGEHAASIETLRRLAEGGRSDERSRQNLALAYGLSGDVDAAARLGRLDLDEGEVRSNLAIFAALRGTDSALTAAALAPVDPAPLPVRERAPRSRAAPRPPIPLAAVALGDADLSVGGSPVGSWFVNLGSFPGGEVATRRWLELRQRHPDALGRLSKLAGAGGRPEPLLVGPVANESEAQGVCANVRKTAPDCRAVKL